ncbi:hypothetical protein DFH07DRAFT_940100 [Mycena maculata]|uniref:DUF7918 domain-containing protein n=1 Tax=Mycena maculata TaxID=230809 RepID=A0AAD7J8C4_9AGAR|nr:hypothetical protein DFH07DRAFT_940100 [Mycena maculata]
MPELGRFSCWVEVDGVKVSEYSPEYSADRKEATCWIPSEVNKKFSIHWTDSKADRTRKIYGFVRIDGIDCGGRELIFAKTGGKWIGTGHRDSVSTSPTTRRPFIFGRQEITDDDNFLNAPISLDLGTIQLAFEDVVCYKTHPTLRQFVSLPPRKLHEQSKKAMGHSVQFGRETRTWSPYQSTTTETVCDTVERLAKFTFKYRPLDLLKANGIAPVDRPRLEKRAAAVEVVPDEDEEAIASKIKALQDQLAAVQNKKQRLLPGRIKKEIKAETSIFLPGEVIDLT